MKLTLDKRFSRKLSNRIGQYEFEVGVLKDVPHFEPGDNRTTYAGGPVRNRSSVKSDKTTAQVFVANMERTNTNFLSEPFEKKSSKLNRFVESFLKLVTDRGMSIKRVENLLQAVVRNPILKEEYGNNKGSTADAKGFDRHLFDTGRMFRNIKARARRVRK